MIPTEFQSAILSFFDEPGWSTTGTLKRSLVEYNPATSESNEIVSSFPVRIIPFDYMNKNEGTGTDSNTLIKTGDKQVFVLPDESFGSIDPTTDTLRIGDIIYNVITVKEMNPTASNIWYHELFVRY